MIFLKSINTLHNMHKTLFNALHLMKTTGPANSCSLWFWLAQQHMLCNVMVKRSLRHETGWYIYCIAFEMEKRINSQ